MLILALVLLQLKHWYIDFVNQSQSEVDHKGIYLNWLGITHSIKHAVATLAIVLCVTGNIGIAIAAGFIDLFLHYHIDFIKMRYGCRDVTKPLFWNQLGFDQLVHQLTYIGIVFILL
jgi:hypothetical protein